MSLVDRVACFAFFAFAALECLAGEAYAWALRVTWVIVATGALIAAHQSELRALNSTKQLVVTDMPQKAPQLGVVENVSSRLTAVEAIVDTVSTVLGDITFSPSQLNASVTSQTPSPPSTKGKSGSFIKRTASNLFSPLRRSSRKSMRRSSDKIVTVTDTERLPSAGSEIPTGPSTLTPSGLQNATIRTKTIESTPLSSPLAYGGTSPILELSMDSFGFGPEAVKPPDSFEYLRPSTWGYLGHLDANQERALVELRNCNCSCVEARENPPTFLLNDATLLRFLRARKFEVDKARRMLESHLAWRDKFMPSLLTPNDIASVLGTGLTRFGPYSKAGLPVTIIKVEYYEPSKFDGDVDLFTRYVAFFFERALNRLPRGADKGILFFDMKGWSLWKHATRFSLKLIAELINIIQAHNPERLDKCILFNTPLVFSGTWSLIKVLLDPVVAEKIVFVSDTALMTQMFDKSVLPKEYGGDRTLPYPIEGFAELHAVNTPNLSS